MVGELEPKNATSMTELANGDAVPNGHAQPVLLNTERVVIYGVDERPPLLQALFLGLQVLCNTVLLFWGNRTISRPFNNNNNG